MNALKESDRFSRYNKLALELNQSENTTAYSVQVDTHGFSLLKHEQILLHDLYNDYGFVWVGVLKGNFDFWTLIEHAMADMYSFNVYTTLDNTAWGDDGEVTRKEVL